MKRLLVFAVLASVTMNLWAFEIETTRRRTTIRQTIPGTNVRSSEPATVIDGDNVYETYRGTNIRNSGAKSYKMEGDTLYETIPGTNLPNRSKGGYVIEEE